MLKESGKEIRCPIYQKWTSMIKRCYSSKYQARQPTYIGCTVCDDWLTFSNFAKWFDLNNVDGWELDKDIIKMGNKVYCPSLCIFVPKSINALMNSHASSRGDFPKGVHYCCNRKKFIAQISIDGDRHFLGNHSTPELARFAYVKAKNAEIMRKCDQYPEFAKYLANHLEE